MTALLLGVAMACGPGGTAPGLSIHGRPSATPASWIAVRDGEGPWRPLDPGRSDWQVPVLDADGSYEVAWVKELSWCTEVWTVKSDLRSDPALLLDSPWDEPAASELIDLVLRFENLPPGKVALVSALKPDGRARFLGLFNPVPPRDPGVKTMAFRGVQDLVVVQCGMEHEGLRAEKALRIPSLAPDPHLTGVVIDLDRAMPVQGYTTGLAGPMGWGTGKFSGAVMTGGGLFPDPTPSLATIEGVLLPWPTAAGEAYLLHAFSQFDRPEGPIRTAVRACHGGTPPPLLVLPAPFEGVRLQAEPLAAEGLALSVEVPAATTWEGFTLMASQSRRDGSQLYWYSMRRNAPGLPGRIAASDLRSLPGWQSRWNLRADAPAEAQFMAFQQNRPWIIGSAATLDREGLIETQSFTDGHWNPATRTLDTAGVSVPIRPGWRLQPALSGTPPSR